MRWQRGKLYTRMHTRFWLSHGVTRKMSTCCPPSISPTSFKAGILIVSPEPRWSQSVSLIIMLICVWLTSQMPWYRACSVPGRPWNGIRNSVFTSWTWPCSMHTSSIRKWSGRSRRWRNMWLRWRDSCWLYTMNSHTNLLHQHVVQLMMPLTTSQLITSCATYCTSQCLQATSFVCSSTAHCSKCCKDTHFMCVECDVPLCQIPCFEEYHTGQVLEAYQENECVYK